MFLYEFTLLYVYEFIRLHIYEFTRLYIYEFTRLYIYEFTISISMSLPSLYIWVYLTGLFEGEGGLGEGEISLVLPLESNKDCRDPT